MRLFETLRGQPYAWPTFASISQVIEITNTKSAVHGHYHNACHSGGEGWWGFMEIDEQVKIEKPRKTDVWELPEKDSNLH